MTRTQWFEVSEAPVRNGVYEMMAHDGSVRKIGWYGFWDIPEPFIVKWRGIAGGEE